MAISNSLRNHCQQQLVALFTPALHPGRWQGIHGDRAEPCRMDDQKYRETPDVTQSCGSDAMRFQKRCGQGPASWLNIHASWPVQNQLITKSDTKVQTIIETQQGRFRTGIAHKGCLGEGRHTLP